MAGPKQAQEGFCLTLLAGQATMNSEDLERDLTPWPEEFPD